MSEVTGQGVEACGDGRRRVKTCRVSQIAYGIVSGLKGRVSDRYKVLKSDQSLLRAGKRTKQFHVLPNSLDCCLNGLNMGIGELVVVELKQQVGSCAVGVLDYTVEVSKYELMENVSYMEAAKKKEPETCRPDTRAYEGLVLVKHLDAIR